MVELVDTLDLKSNDHCGRAGSSPAPSTRTLVNHLIFKGFLFNSVNLANHLLKVLYLQSRRKITFSYILPLDIKPLKDGKV
jgi:hypothetical protein